MTPRSTPWPPLGHRVRRTRQAPAVAPSPRGVIAWPEYEIITPEMQAVVGVESEPWALEVDKLQIRLFARAVGYTDPLFYDEAFAQIEGVPEPALPAALPGHADLRSRHLGPDVRQPTRTAPPPRSRAEARAQRRHRDRDVRHDLRRRHPDGHLQDRQPRPSARAASARCSSPSPRRPTAATATWWLSSAAPASTTDHQPEAPRSTGCHPRAI